MNNDTFQYTIEDYIEIRKEAVRNKVTSQLANQYNKKRKKNRKLPKWKVYKNDPECKKMIQKALEENEEYQKFFSEELINDPDFLSAYKDDYQIRKAKYEGIQKEKDFKEFINQDEEIKLLYQEFFNDVETKLKDDIIHYLKTASNIKVESDDNYSDSLGIRTFDEFEQNVKFYDWILEFADHKLEYSDHNIYNDIWDFLVKRNDTFKNFLKDTENNDYFTKDYLYDELCDNMIEQYFEMLEHLEQVFNFETVLSYLKQNPNYISMFKELEEIERKKEEEQKRIRALESSILHAIPDNIIDLYPLARKMHRHFILHIGETNSGKTYGAIEALKKSEKGIYLAPLRLLAYEQYDKLNGEGYPCTLKTGEERLEIAGAKLQSSTIEMLDVLTKYEVAVIDEAQMISDRSRGGAWTKAMLGLQADEIHVCAAPEAKNVLIKIITACGDSYDVIEHKRNTPLIMEDKGFAFPRDVKKGDALIVFSRRSVHGVANELKQKKKIKASIIYGALPYDVRQNEAKRFSDGKTEVVVTTDAIGMGMNLPIKRIVFLEQEKYDGFQVRSLNQTEVKQIAGRAGRFGIFNEGLVNTLSERRLIRSKLESEIPSIQKAFVQFPESLIGLDAPLSEILERWKDIKVQDGFEKANIDHELALVRIAEGITQNKQVIYEFITMPFDEENDTLLQIWTRMLRAYCKEEHIALETFERSYLPRIFRDNLESLESAYRIYDLIFFYNDKFEGGKDSDAVMMAKNTISEDIMKLLESSKLSVRRCKYCGKILPWNHRYGMCESCHDSLYRYNYYY